MSYDGVKYEFKNKLLKRISDTLYINRYQLINSDMINNVFKDVVKSLWNTKSLKVHTINLLAINAVLPEPGGTVITITDGDSFLPYISIGDRILIQKAELDNAHPLHVAHFDNFPIYDDYTKPLLITEIDIENSTITVNQELANHASVTYDPTAYTIYISKDVYAEGYTKVLQDIRDEAIYTYHNYSTVIKDIPSETDVIYFNIINETELTPSAPLKFYRLLFDDLIVNGKEIAVVSNSSKNFIRFESVNSQLFRYDGFARLSNYKTINDEELTGIFMFSGYHLTSNSYEAPIRNIYYLNILNWKNKLYIDANSRPNAVNGQAFVG